MLAGLGAGGIPEGGIAEAGVSARAHVCVAGWGRRGPSGTPQRALPWPCQARPPESRPHRDTGRQEPAQRGAPHPAPGRGLPEAAGAPGCCRPLRRLLELSSALCTGSLSLSAGVAGEAGPREMAVTWSGVKEEAAEEEAAPAAKGASSRGRGEVLPGAAPLGPLAAALSAALQCPVCLLLDGLVPPARRGRCLWPVALLAVCCGGKRSSRLGWASGRIKPRSPPRGWCSSCLAAATWLVLRLRLGVLMIALTSAVRTVALISLEVQGCLETLPDVLSPRGGDPPGQVRGADLAAVLGGGSEGRHFRVPADHGTKEDPVFKRRRRSAQWCPPRCPAAAASPIGGPPAPASQRQVRTCSPPLTRLSGKLESFWDPPQRKWRWSAGNRRKDSPAKCPNFRLGNQGVFQPLAQYFAIS